MELPGKRFNENAKMRIPRASADLKFLLGKSPIRAPGRRTRNGPFRISTTYGNVLSIPKIWTQYYNKPEDYHALREIKRKLDPDDLFHSKFTLRPAKH